MVSAINKELIPLGARLPQMGRRTVGGYFVWLTLPAGLKSDVVAQRAQEEENVVVAQVGTALSHTHTSPAHLFAQGQIFEVPGDNKHAGTRFDNDIRYVVVVSRSHCSIAAQPTAHAWTAASHRGWSTCADSNRC